MRALLLPAFLLLASPALAGDLPDPALTPGAIMTTDAAVVCTQATPSPFATPPARSRPRSMPNNLAPSEDHFLPVRSNHWQGEMLTR